MDTAHVVALTALVALLVSPAASLAQTITIKPVTPAASAAAPGTPLLVPANAPKETATEAAERAKRLAEGPMYWIRLNAQRAAAEDKAAAAAKPAAAGATATAAVKAAAGTTAPDVGLSVARVPAAVVRAADQAGSTAAPAQTAAAEPPKPEPVQVASIAPQPAAPLSPPPAAPAVQEPETLVLMSGNEPKFPDSLMRRLRRGTVQMKVDVGTDGLVTKATVVSSTHPRLEQAAQEAALAMRFQPLRNPNSAEINFSFDVDN